MTPSIPSTVIPSALPGYRPGAEGPGISRGENAGPSVSTPPSVAPSSSPEAGTARAPDGVDPALWSLLTGEERTHFLKSRSLGPLTYGQGSRSTTSDAPPALRGGRLDVRV